MIRFGLLVILVFLRCSTSFAQDSDDEAIVWNEEIAITWDDFKAVPEKNSHYHANTNSGVSFTWDYSTRNAQPDLQFHVLSKFYPMKSWVKAAYKNSELLAHEKLHFDISELYARKLRKALEAYEVGRNIRRDLNLIYNRVETERTAMQKLFDKETKHSENREAELKWRQQIQVELEKLKAYEN